MGASCLDMYNRGKPYLGVIFLQFGYAGMPIITKTAINQGMNIYTYTVYRNAIAALTFTPFAVFLERSSSPSVLFFHAQTHCTCLCACVSEYFFFFSFLL